MAEARARMIRRKKSLARIKAQIEADSLTIAQAEIEEANRTVILGGRLRVAGDSVNPLATEKTAYIAPTETPIVSTPDQTLMTPPTRPEGGRRGR